MTWPDRVVTTHLLDRLRGGEPPDQARQALNLSAAEYAAALGQAALGGDDPADWPGLVQARPRRPWLAPALGEAALNEAFPHASRPARLTLAAGLLQVHDFWEPSHEAAQQADDLGERRFSAYWHGIAHRREPDPSNAAYWFRRVGRHPLFDRLAREVRPLLETEDPPVVKLLGDFTPVWNSSTLIDLCTNARAEPRAALARKLQRLEMSALLEETLLAL